jgi:hypothetical protein
LLADDAFLAHCKAAAGAASSPPPIATIGTTTRDRPDLLRRGLGSFIENAGRYGRAHDYVVIDDGVTPEERAATREALAALGQQAGAAVRYASRSDRESFADELAAAAGVPAEVVRFALLGDPEAAITTGAARNSLLLDTAGDLCLLVDDDSVCRTAPCPRIEPGLSLDARTNPTELWFHADRDTMLRDTPFV